MEVNPDTGGILEYRYDIKSTGKETSSGQTHREIKHTPAG
jgi:hypothetical protein